MQQINPVNTNTPELSDGNFQRKYNGGELQYVDMPRFKLLAQKYTEGRYLDIGCYNSPYPGVIAEQGGESWGIDHAGGVIRKMREVQPEVNYVVGDVYDLPFKDTFFDYVVMGEVIEHLSDPAAAIKEAARVLKPGGWLALSTPWSELNQQGPVSPVEHMWSFEDEDIVELLQPYGQPELTHYQDSIKVIIAYVQKN